MSYKLKQKSRLWLFWQHNSYTTIGKTIYCPPGKVPSPSTIEHEKVHMWQQEQVGLFGYIFLYLFCLPVLWNPFRKMWEREAYMAEGLTEKETDEILKTSLYGWLL